MNLRKAFVLSGLVVVIALVQIVLAQEVPVVPATDSVVITSSQQAAISKDNDMQWAWGEVINLDNQAKTVTLKYLDYETDQEKELLLAVDEKTTFENVKDFDELKLNDTLSIDYVIGVDNNLAKNISFEKPDESSVEPAQENGQSPASTSSVEQSGVEAVSQSVAQSKIPVD